MKDSKNNFVSPKYVLKNGTLRLCFGAVLLMAGPVLAQQAQTGSDPDAIIYDSNQLADPVAGSNAADNSSLAENQPLELIKLLDDKQQETDLSLQQSDSGPEAPQTVAPQTSTQPAVMETQAAPQPAVSPASRAPRIGRRPLSSIVVHALSPGSSLEGT